MKELILVGRWFLAGMAFEGGSLLVLYLVGKNGLTKFSKSHPKIEKIYNDIMEDTDTEMAK